MQRNHRPDAGFWSDFVRVISLEFLLPYLPILLLAAFLLGAAVSIVLVTGLALKTALIGVGVCAGVVVLAWGLQS